MGIPLSQDTKDKLSKAMTGRKASQETRNKMSASHMGRLVSQETRNKISASNMGHIVSQETRNKISNTNMGHIHSQETKDKISAAGIGRKQSQETKEKTAITKKNNPLSQEARNKISKARKGLILSQDTINKISANATGKSNPNYGVEVSQHTIDKRRISSASAKKNKCRVSVDNIHYYSFVGFAKTFGVTGFHEATTIALTGQPSPRQLKDIRERNHHKIVYIDTINRSLQQGWGK